MEKTLILCHTLQAALLFLISLKAKQRLVQVSEQFFAPGTAFKVARDFLLCLFIKLSVDIICHQYLSYLIAPHFAHPFPLYIPPFFRGPFLIIVRTVFYSPLMPALSLIAQASIFLNIPRMRAARRFKKSQRPRKPAPAPLRGSLHRLFSGLIRHI